MHYAAWRRTRVGIRGLLLYVLASPLPFAAIIALAGGALTASLASAAAFALIVSGASLNRRGILEELVAPERRYTRPLRVPHKYLAVIAVSAGVAVAASGSVGQPVAVSLAFGLLAGVGFHLAYRLPHPASVLGLGRERVADKGLQQALEQAERRILSIEKAALSVGNPELDQRLSRIAKKGRAVLQVIVQRPAERFRARKFLNVYLEGAERVAGRYVQTHRWARGRALEAKFRNVLVEIERVFDRQLVELAEHDIFDLDVQIEVLRRQLEREGIT
jgi:hypothetical protein